MSWDVTGCSIACPRICDQSLQFLTKLGKMLHNPRARNYCSFFIPHSPLLSPILPFVTIEYTFVETSRDSSAVEQCFCKAEVRGPNPRPGSKRQFSPNRHSPGSPRLRKTSGGQGIPVTGPKRRFPFTVHSPIHSTVQLPFSAPIFYYLSSIDIRMTKCESQTMEDR